MKGIPVETLTDRYSISYAPSGTFFADLQERRLTQASTVQLLALGDPNFPAPATSAPRPVPPEQGLFVTRVQPGSNAARSGIHTGDVLQCYAGASLASRDDLQAAITRNADSGQDALALDLWRDGQAQTVRVRPGPLGVGLSAQPPAVALRALWSGADAVSASLGRGTFAPLPGSRREVAAIARLFPQATVLLGTDASAPALEKLAAAGQLKDYRYLHLATHGVPRAEHGLSSYLALAQDHLPDPLTVPVGQALDNGQLTAERMLRWKLEADLVTLSACETGLGQYQGGEGYLGFAQALFLSGARTLVLSQWKVDDTAAALLMQRFYQNLRGQRTGLDRPLPKAAALAEAKQWLCQMSRPEADLLTQELNVLSRGSEKTVPTPIAEPTAPERPYAHPYYWAAFILIGEPGDIAPAMPVLAAPVAVAVPTAVPAPAAAEPRRWPWAVAAAVALTFASLWWRRHRLPR
jgi:hypothetical protein